jgi:hypothetical protein
MDHFVPVRSQRPLSSAPPTALISSPNDNSALAVLWKIYGAEPVKLRRTQKGRELSRARYRRAEEFITSLTPNVPVIGPISSTQPASSCNSPCRPICWTWVSPMLGALGMLAFTLIDR